MYRKHQPFGAVGRLAGLLLLSTMTASCSLPIKPQIAQQTYRINPLIDLHTPAITEQGKSRTFMLRMQNIEADTGFDSSAMMYSPQAQQLRPYRDNRWLAPPADMLTDALKQTLVRQPWIQGVVPNSAGVPVSLNLRCHLNRLEHDMTGVKGQVRLVLDCLWLDPAQRSVRAHWYFDQARTVSRNDASHFASASQALADKALGEIVETTRRLLAESPSADTQGPGDQP